MINILNELKSKGFYLLEKDKDFKYLLKREDVCLLIDISNNTFELFKTKGRIMSTTNQLVFKKISCITKLIPELNGKFT